MAFAKLCDFCLEEKGGFFRSLEELQGGYHICSKCKKRISEYGLPVKYDILQLLVQAPENMHEMMMRAFLETHSADDTLARLYPSGNKMLHRGEELVSVVPAKITVQKDLIPAGNAITELIDVQKKDIINLPSVAGENGEPVTGVLYETNAAIYFFSEHFLNVHRISNLLTADNDPGAIHILEKNRAYKYAIDHADLFRIRHQFYHILYATRKHRKDNLIYLSGDNTMTLTPGIYTVPKNIKAGIYWLTSADGSKMRLQGKNGQTLDISNGRVELTDGMLIECSGKHELRIYNPSDPVFRKPSGNGSEPEPKEKVPSFEEVTGNFTTIR